MYFVVMTQTTVGYGVPYSHQLNVTEMIFIMILQFSGIAMFSTIVNEVFSFKSEAKVEDMVKREKTELENLLFKLSTTFDNSGNHVKRLSKESLPGHVFDKSLMHIDDSIRYSTKLAFR